MTSHHFWPVGFFLAISWNFGVFVVAESDFEIKNAKIRHVLVPYHLSDGNYHIQRFHNFYRDPVLDGMRGFVAWANIFHTHQIRGENVYPVIIRKWYTKVSIIYVISLLCVVEYFGF